MTTPTSLTPFRPLSLEDFSRTAKNLAWLIREPLQTTQELLAQIYGYSGRHELQRSLAAPGTPGPFDDESAHAGLSYRQLLMRSHERRARIEARIGTGLAARSQFEAERRADVAEIGLFCSPAMHRQLFTRVRAKYLAAKGELEISGSSVLDYATRIYDDTGRPKAFAFTAMGSAVYQAAMMSTPVGCVPKSAMSSFLPTIRALQLKHPHHPWLFAMELAICADAWGLGSWAAYHEHQLPEGVSRLTAAERLQLDAQLLADTDEANLAQEMAELDSFAMLLRSQCAGPTVAPGGVLEAVNTNAPLLYPRVQTAFADFETIATAAIPHSKVPAIATHGRGDEQYHGHFFYFGARVAEAMSDYPLTRKLLNAFEGARSPFNPDVIRSRVILELVTGNIVDVPVTYPSFKKNAAETEEPGWFHFAQSLAAGECTRYREGATCWRLATALKRSWALVEAFADPLEGRESLPNLTQERSRDSSIDVAEFMYRTRAFWDSVPETRAALAAILRDGAVRSAVVRYHLCAKLWAEIKPVRMADGDPMVAVALGYREDLTQAGNALDLAVAGAYRMINEQLCIACQVSKHSKGLHVCAACFEAAKSAMKIKDAELGIGPTPSPQDLARAATLPSNVSVSVIDDPK